MFFAFSAKFLNIAINAWDNSDFKLVDAFGFFF